MKKLEKVIALLLAAVMTFSLAACNKSGGGDTPTTAPTQAATTAPTQAAQPGADDVTQAPSVNIDDTKVAEELTFAEGTVLRMATGYNNTKTGITMDSETAGEGITLADGVTYHAGDLKPTWVELQKRLGMVFEDKWTGAGSASKEFDYWKEQLDQVDMVAGAAGDLSEYGAAGYLVNIADYLDLMPNFKACLESNSIVGLSITGSTTGDNKGAIHF